MAKTDIGLKLMSLYRDITKARHNNDTRHNNDSGRASNDLIRATQKIANLLCVSVIDYL